MCLGALIADSRINGGAKISVKSFFIEIVFFLCVFSTNEVSGNTNSPRS